MEKKGLFLVVSVFFLVVFFSFFVSISYGSTQKFEFLTSSYYQNLNTSLSNTNWTLYFKTSLPGDLSIKNLDDDKITFSKMYYSTNNGTSWSVIFPSSNDGGKTLSVDWQYNNTVIGKIVYDIVSFDRYRLNVSFYDENYVLENYDFFYQKDRMFNISNPLISYSLCHFNNSYRKCGDSFFEEKIIMPANSSKTFYFDIPKNSTVKSISFSLVPSYSDTLYSFSHSGMSSTFAACVDNVTGYDLLGIISSNEYNLYSFSNYSNADSIYTNTLSFAPVDLAVTNFTGGLSHIAVLGDHDIAILNISGDEVASYYDAISTFTHIASGELKNRFDSYYDFGTIFNYSSIRSDRNVTYYINFSFASFSQKACYIRSRLQYYNDAANQLRFKIGSSIYNVDSSYVKTSNLIEHNFTSNTGEIVSYPVYYNDTFVFIPSLNDTQSADCVFGFSIYANDSFAKNLSVFVDGLGYNISNSNINKRNIESLSLSNDIPISYAPIKSLSYVTKKLTFDYSNITSNKICLLDFGLNYKGRKPQNMTLYLNSTNYLVDLTHLYKNLDASYNSLNNFAVNISKITDNVYYTLSLPDPLYAKVCFVDLKLNYIGSKIDDLYIDANSVQYKVDISSLNVTNELLFNVQNTDNLTDSSYCIGCSGGSLYGTRAYFNLNSLNLPPQFNALNCYVQTDLCYNNSNFMNLSIYVGSNSYKVNNGSIQNCGIGFNSVNTEVLCSDILSDEDKKIYYECRGCSDTNNYMIGLDNSTNSSSSEYLNASGMMLLLGDYLAKVYTNTSTLGETLTTQVACTDLSNNTNITFVCPSCDSDNNYNLLIDSKLTYNSFVNSNLISNSLSVVVKSNESLDYDKISVPVKCSDLSSGFNLTMSCSVCNSTDYVSLIKDATEKEFIYLSYFNSSLNKTKFLTDCTAFETGNVSISCKNCSNGDIFYIEAEQKNSMYSNSRTIMNKNVLSYSPTIKITSNQSLLYSDVYTSINCADLSSPVNLTYYCESCTPSSEYRIVLNSNITKKTYLNGTQSNGNAEVSVFSYYSDPYFEIVASDDSDNLLFFNSTLSKLSEVFVGSKIRKIIVFEVDSNEPGKEIAVISKTGLYIYNSKGILLRSLSLYEPLSLDVFDLNGDFENEIIVGSKNGNLTVYNKAFSVLDNLMLSNEVSYIKGFYDEQGESSLFVLVDLLTSSKIYLLNSTLDEKYNFTTKRSKSVDICDVSDFFSSESLYITSNDVSINTFNIPRYVNIDILSDGSYEKNFSKLLSSVSYFNESLQDSLISSINSALFNCVLPTCSINISFDVSSSKMAIKNWMINYTYNASGIVNMVSNYFHFSKIYGVHADEYVPYNSTRLDYLISNVPIFVSNLTYDSFSSLGTYVLFNGNNCTKQNRLIVLGSTSVNGGIVSSYACDSDYLISSFFKTLSNYVYFEPLVTDIAIRKVLNTSVVNNTFSYNINIYQSYPSYNQTFYDVIFNQSIDDSNFVLEPAVDVKVNNSNFTITPSSFNVLCNSSSPVYQSFEVAGLTIKICKADFNSNSKADFYNFIQSVSDNGVYFNVSYKIYASDNFAPYVTNVTNNTDTLYYGANITYNFSVVDMDSNNVSVIIWHNFGGVWYKLREINKTNGLTSQKLYFNITTNYSMIGTNYVKFDYADYNSQGLIRNRVNASEMSFVVNKHNLSVSLNGPYNKTINQEDDLIVHFSCNVTDVIRNESVSGAFCRLYMNGTYRKITTSDSNGACSFNINDLSLPIGNYNWDIRVLSEPKYYDSYSQIYNVTVSDNLYGRLNVSVISPPNGTVVYNLLNLSVRVRNESGAYISNATLVFNTPQGNCLSVVENTAGNYTCLYEKSGTLPSGNYIWNATASRLNYLSATSSNGLITVIGGINAIISYSQPLGAKLYRLADAMGNNSIQISITNITDGVNPLTDVKYDVYFDGLLRATGDYNFTGGNTLLTIVNSYSVGTKPLIINLSKTNYTGFNDYRTYDIYSGILSRNVNGQSQDNVFLSGIVNRTANLTVNITDKVNISIASANVNFHINGVSLLCVAGVQYLGNGLYRCVFFPNGFSVGDYVWNVSVSKQYYDSLEQSMSTISIKDVAKPFVSVNSSYLRARNVTVLVDVKDSSNVTIPSAGFNCSVYIDKTSSGVFTYLGKVQSNSSGVCRYVFNFDCSYEPRNYQIMVNITSNNSRYRIDENSISYVNMYDTVDFNIVSPTPNPYYTQTDVFVPVKSNVNDTCGPLSSSYYTNVKYIDSFSAIQQGPNTSYYIPLETSGSINLTIFSNYPYHLSNNKTLVLDLKDYIKIKYLSSETFNRDNFPNDDIYVFEAQIHTGNDIKINESDYTGVWSNYNCSFYFNNTYEGSNQTDSKGYCRFSKIMGCSYPPHFYNVTLVLSNLSQMTYNYTPYNGGGNVTSYTLLRYDPNARISISYPTAGQNYMYGDEFTLVSNVSDSCNQYTGNYTVEWNYISELANENIGYGKTKLWIVASNAFKNTTITAKIFSSVYNQNITNVSIFAYRRAVLSNLNAPLFWPTATPYNYTCTVDISGLDNKSNFNVTFIVDGTNVFRLKTNYSGVAMQNYTFLTNGSHKVECNISADIGNFINVSTTLSEIHKEQTVINPSLVQISDVFFHNREWNLNNPPELFVTPNTTFFRSSVSPEWAPEEMFVGASVYIFDYSKGQFVHLDNATMKFYVETSPGSGTYVNFANCTTNVYNFENNFTVPYKTGEEAIDNFYLGRMCKAIWNPPTSNALGTYNIKINVTKSGSGWTSPQITQQVTLKGLLDIDSINIANGEDIYTDETSRSLSIHLHDDAGSDISSGVFTEFYYDDDDCGGGWNIGNDSVGSSGNWDYNWNVQGYDNGLIKSQYYYESTFYLYGRVSGSNYIDPNQRTQAMPNSPDCAKSSRKNYEMRSIEPHHRVQVYFDEPTPGTPIMAWNGTYKTVHFQCGVLRAYDGMPVTNYPIEWKCKSGNCTGIPSYYNTTNWQGIAGFNIDFTSKQDYIPADFNFSCNISRYNGPSGRFVPTLQQANLSIKVAKFVTFEGGTCNYNGSCDYNIGETFNSCPNNTWVRGDCNGECYRDGDCDSLMESWVQFYRWGSNASNTTPWYNEDKDAPADGTAEEYRGHWRNMCPDCNPYNKPPIVQSYSCQSWVNTFETGTGCRVQVNIYDPDNNLASVSMKVGGTSYPLCQEGTTYWYYSRTGSCAGAYQYHTWADNSQAEVEIVAEDSNGLKTTKKFYPSMENGPTLPGTCSIITPSGSGLIYKPGDAVNVRVQNSGGYDSGSYGGYGIYNAVWFLRTTVSYQGDREYFSETDLAQNYWDGTIHVISGETGKSFELRDWASHATAADPCVTLSYTVDENPPSISNEDVDTGFATDTHDTTNNPRNGVGGSCVCSYNAYSCCPDSALDGSVTITADLNDAEKLGYAWLTKSGDTAHISGCDKALSGTSDSYSCTFSMASAGYGHGNPAIVVVHVNDSVGWSVTKNVNVYIDNTAPSIGTVTSSKYYVKTGDTYDLSVDSITDSGPATFNQGSDAYSHVWLEYNSALYGGSDMTKNVNAYSKNGLTAASLTTEGINTITVFARDNHGKYASKTIDITKDDTRPTVNIGNPTADQVLNGQLTFTATVSDANYNDSNVWYCISATSGGCTPNVAMSCSSGNCQVLNLDTSGYANEDWFFRVRATDKAGWDNNPISERRFITDHTMPQAVPISPSVGQRVEGTFYFNATITDPADPTSHPDTATYKICFDNVNCDGTTLMTGYGSNRYYATYNTASLSEGTHTVTFVAKDTASTPNVNRSTVSFNSDNQAPTVSITSPTTSQKFTGSISVVATITDAAGNLNYSRARVNGATETANITGASPVYTYTVDSTLVPDNATATITVRALDLMAHQGIDTETVYIDNTPPVMTYVNFMAPENDYIVRTNVTVTLDTDGTDFYFGAGGLASCNASFSTDTTLGNGDDIFLVNLGTDCDGDILVPSAVSNNNYYIFVEATDWLNHRTNRSRTFVLDNIAPHITYLRSNDTDNYSSNVQSVNISVTADDFDLITGNLTSVILNGVSMSGNLQLGGNFSYVGNLSSLGCLVEGVFCTLTANATDLAGNSNITTLQIFIDNTAPRLNLVSFSDSYLYSNQNVSASITLINNENTSTISYVRVEGQNLAWDDFFTAWRGNIIIRNDTIFNIDVSDKADNRVSNSSYMYVVDDIRPRIHSVSYSDLDNISNSKDQFTFTMNVSDVNNSFGTGQIWFTMVYGNNTFINRTMTSLGAGIYSVVTNLSNIGYETNLNGVYNISFRVYDQAENWNNTFFNITVDNIAPMIRGKYYYNQTIDSVFSIYGSSPEFVVKPPTGAIPYHITIPIKNITWEVNASDIFLVNVTLKSNVTANLSLMSYSGIGNLYVINNVTTKYFNVSEESYYNFTAAAIDKANNINYTNWIVFISTIKPNFNTFSVVDAMPNGNYPTGYEPNHGYLTLEVNMTLNSVNLTDNNPVRITIIGPTFNDTIYLNGTGDSDFESLLFNYTPKEVGNYNVTGFAMNSIGLTDEKMFGYIFTVTGKTTASINFTSGFPLLISNLTRISPSSRLINITIVNTGSVSMYNSTISLGTLNGIISPLEGVPYNCPQRVGPGSSCVLLTYLNFTYILTPGPKTVSAYSLWTHPDDAGGSIIDTVTYTVEKNTYLKSSRSNFSDVICYYGQVKNIGNLDIVSFGNTELVNITISKNSGSINFSWLNFTPNNISLIAQDSLKNVIVNITSLGLGVKNISIMFNATGSVCEPVTECVDYIYINTTTYDYSNIFNVTPELPEYNRTVMNLTCYVFAGYQGFPIANYSVNFTVSDKFNSSKIMLSVLNVTNSDGYSSVYWNATNVTPSNYTVFCGIRDNLSIYYIANVSNKTREIKLWGKLNLNVTFDNESVYWYDTKIPFNKTYNVTVRDEAGNFVSGVYVPFYSNATKPFSYEKIGECTTLSDGKCQFVWNPSLESSGNFSVFYNASKENYYPTATYNSTIVIVGGYTVDILTPTNGQDLFYNYNPPNGYTLSLQITDSNGTLVSDYGSLIYLNWTFNISGGTALIANLKQSSNNWYLNYSNSNYTKGPHVINAYVMTGSGETFRDESPPIIYVRDRLAIDNQYINSTNILRKGGSFRTSAHVYKLSDNSNVANYTCYFYDYNNGTYEYEGSSLTNNSGICSFVYTSNQDKIVDWHLARINISSNTTLDYLVDSNNYVNVSFFLNETLNVTLLSVSAYDIFLKTNVYLLNSSVTDQYSRILPAAALSYKLLNTSYSEIKTIYSPSYPFEYLWEIPNNNQIGEFILRAYSTYGEYNSNVSDRRIYINGYSKVQFITLTQNLSLNNTISSTLYRDSLTKAECFVSDYNLTALQIENYPVEFRIYNVSNQTTYLISSVINLTNSFGVASYIFNSSNISKFTLGNYAFSCRIYDNQTLYYNISGTNNSFVYPDMYDTFLLDYTLNETLLYRDDEYNLTPNPVLVSFTLRDSGVNVQNATIYLYDNRSLNYSLNVNMFISSCVTDSAGTCIIVWNPNSTVKAGINRLYAYAVKTYYDNSSTVSKNIEIRVHSKPDFLTKDGKLVYNNVVPVTIECLAKESNSSLLIGDYNYPLTILGYQPSLFDYMQIIGNISTYFNEYVSSTNSFLWLLNSSAGEYSFGYLDNSLVVSTTDYLSLKTEQVNLSLDAYDYIYINSQNLSNGFYSITGKNATDQINLVPWTNVTPAYFYFNNSNFTSLIFAFDVVNGVNTTFSVFNITFQKTVYDRVTPVASSVALGYDANDFSGAALFAADMEQITPQVSCTGTTWCFTSSGTNNTFLRDSSVSKRGSNSLSLNLSNLEANKTASMILSIAAPYYNITMYDYISFWLYSTSSNFTYQFNITRVSPASYVFTKELGSFVGWKYFEYPIPANAKNINKIIFSAMNSKDVNQSIKFYLDEIRLLEKTYAVNGTATMLWHPPALGKYKLICYMNDSFYYNVSDKNDTIYVELIDSYSSDVTFENGQGRPGEEVVVAEISGINVESFDVYPKRLDYIVPVNSSGFLAYLQIVSNIGNDLHMKLSTEDNYYKFDKNMSINSTNVTLLANSYLLVPIYYNVTNISVYPIYTSVIVESLDTDEMINVPSIIRPEKVSVGLLYPSRNENLNNVISDDILYLKIKSTFNDSDTFNKTNFLQYVVGISGKNCVVLNKTFNVSDNTYNLYCKAPFLPENPINNSLDIFALLYNYSDDSGFKGTGYVKNLSNGSVLYLDILGPVITMGGILELQNNITGFASAIDNYMAGFMSSSVVRLNETYLKNSFSNSGINNTKICNSTNCFISMENKTILKSSVDISPYVVSVFDNFSNTTSFIYASDITVNIRNKTLWKYDDVFGKSIYFVDNINMKSLSYTSDLQNEETVSNAEQRMLIEDKYTIQSSYLPYYNTNSLVYIKLLKGANILNASFLISSQKRSAVLKNIRSLYYDNITNKIFVVSDDALFILNSDYSYNGTVHKSIYQVFPCDYANEKHICALDKKNTKLVFGNYEPFSDMILYDLSDSTFDARRNLSYSVVSSAYNLSLLNLGWYSTSSSNVLLNITNTSAIFGQKSLVLNITHLDPASDDVLYKFGNTSLREITSFYFYGRTNLDFTKTNISITLHSESCSKIYKVNMTTVSTKIVLPLQDFKDTCKNSIDSFAFSFNSSMFDEGFVILDNFTFVKENYDSLKIIDSLNYKGYSEDIKSIKKYIYDDVTNKTYLLDGKGNAVFVLLSNGSIKKYDFSNTGYNLSNPISFDKFNNTLYITDTSNDRIMMYDFNGTDYTLNLLSFGETGLNNYSFYEPSDIDQYFDSYGNNMLAVSDYQNNRVLFYNHNPSGYLYNSTISGLDKPFMVSVDSNNKLVYVGDSKALRIYNYSTMKSLQNITLLGLFDPYNISVDVGNDKRFFPLVVQDDLVEYKYNDYFRKNQTFDIKSSLSDQLSACDYSYSDLFNSYCFVPVQISTLNFGDVVLSSLDIKYTINITLSSLESDFSTVLYNSASNLTNISFVFRNGDVNASLYMSNLKIYYVNSTLNSSNVLFNKVGNYVNTTDTYRNISNGDYLFFIKSKDTNNNYAVKGLWFDIYQTALFNASIKPQNKNISVDVTLLVNTSLDKYSYFNYSLDDNSSIVIDNVSMRNFDMILNISSIITDKPDMNRSNVEATFEGISFTYRNDSNNKSFVDNSILIDTFSFNDLNLPPKTKPFVLGGISLNASFSFQNLKLEFDYSPFFYYFANMTAVSNILGINEGMFRVYKCPKFDARQCMGSDWSELTSYVLNQSKKIYAYTSSTSSYLVLQKESEETKEEEQEQVQNPNQQQSNPDQNSRNQQDTSSSMVVSQQQAQIFNDYLYCGDFICSPEIGENIYTCPIDCIESVRLTGVCGNDICELGENIDNCPNDCAYSPISIQFSNNNIVGYAGMNSSVLLTILNNKNKSVSLVMGFSNKLKDYLFVDNISVMTPNELRNFSISVNIPPSETPKSIVGDLMILSNLRLTNVPVYLKITTREQAFFEMMGVNLNLLSDSYTEENTILVAHVKADFSVFRDANVSEVVFYYRIKDSQTGDVLDTGSFVRPTQKNLDDLITLNIQKQKEGSYYLELSSVSDFSSSVTDSYDVKASFFSMQTIRKSLFILILLLIVGGVIFAIHRYEKYMENKARYLLPNLAKIPSQTEESYWIGKIGSSEHRAYFDPSKLTTHMLVAGSTGSGKSVTASVIVEEALLKKIPVVIFDPTAQWTGFVKACNDEFVLKRYKQFGISTDDVRPFKGLIYHVKTPDIKLDFKKYMNPGEVTVFNLNDLKGESYDAAVGNIISSMFSIHWEEYPDLRLLVVFDEVHRLLTANGGKVGYLALEKACREFRKWGIGLIMVSQVSSDFKEAVGGNVLTEVQLNTKSMTDIEKIKSKYGEEFAKRITRLGIGVGIIQNPHFNDGKPWFVSFRPPYHSPHKIVEEELEMYDKYSRELDSMEETVLSKQKKGVDTSDVELELKLARDKLKEGRFKMAEVYIDSLRNSISKL